MPFVKSCFKIIEYENDQIKTLFHGLNGSRTMPTDKWLTAVKKRVKDGTSKTTYLSGWHILLNIEECEDYLLKFTKRLDKLKIVECEARGLRPKTHSPDNVWLADQIKFSLKETKKGPISTGGY
jgi:hypothetical protein